MISNCFIVLLVFTPPLALSDTNLPLIEYKYVYTLTGEADKPLKMPTDIAIGNQQRIYIVDSGNNRITVYGNNGRFLFNFGSKGSGKGKLDSPVGITTSKDGRVFVADRGNKRIQIYDADGQYISTIPAIIGNSEFEPVDVAVNKTGSKIWVSASAPHHRIVVYNVNGKVIDVWGKPGNNHGEFRYPASLVRGTNEETYVIDVFNTRVQIFDNKGKFLVSVGSWGVTPGSLFRPKGIAIQDDEKIIVSDSYLGVLQIFNSDTRFSAVLGVNKQIAYFDTPAGLAVDNKKRVYVAELLANRVSVLVPAEP